MKFLLIINIPKLKGPSRHRLSWAPANSATIHTVNSQSQTSSQPVNICHQARRTCLPRNNMRQAKITFQPRNNITFQLKNITSPLRNITFQLESITCQNNHQGSIKSNTFQHPKKPTFHLSQIIICRPNPKHLKAPTSHPRAPTCHQANQPPATFPQTILTSRAIKPARIQFHHSTSRISNKTRTSR